MCPQLENTTMISALELSETSFGPLQTRKDIGHLMVIAGHEVWPPMTEKPRLENISKMVHVPPTSKPNIDFCSGAFRDLFWVIGDQEGHWSSDGHCMS